MPEQVTNEYLQLIHDLGFAPGSDQTFGASGLISGDALRSQPEDATAGNLLDKKFRYASVLKEEKVGITHVFELDGSPCIYFKSLAAEPTDEQLRHWQRTVWNHGLGRMLWVVTPQTVRVFNAFEPPEGEPSAGGKFPAELLTTATSKLEKLRQFELDRISLESGQFWSTAAGRRIDKSKRIDEQLAADLEIASQMLVDRGCPPLKAHRLMLRTMFTAYLEARGVLPQSLFEELNASTFSEILTSSRATKTFFERMCETFNGDLFPPPPKAKEQDESYSFTNSQLEVARSIAIRRDPKTGQQTFDFWRYDFEVIPIELISSIYEKFIYAGDPDLAKSRGTHYTPVNLVDLVFSQVFDDGLFDEPLESKPKVLDLACGSGVFLVEAYRRLLGQRIARGERWNRTLVRDVLTKQLYGVDLEETAIEIAAFSLCLTAFELDPSPDSIKQLKFRQSLKGKNLFADDAFSDDGFAVQKEFAKKDFAIVVGNPPWSKTKGAKTSKQTKANTHINYCNAHDPPIELPYRSPIDQAFIWRSRDFARPRGRIGLIVDAKNFFSQQKQSLTSKRQFFTTIRTRVMLNLSALHDRKLFPSAKQPAMVFVGEKSTPEKDDELVFASTERSDTFRRHGIVELFLERVNRLPVSKVASDRFLLKTASHGTPRDHAIIESLYNRFSNLQTVLESWNTSLHGGYKGRTGSVPVSEEIRAMRMLERTPLVRGRMDTSGLPEFSYTTMDRPRDPSIYYAPLLITQQRLRDNRLVAASIVDSTVYARSYFGIPLQELWQSELLTAYLNSSLAAYCFLLTSTRFGIDRQIAEQSDIRRLPFRTASRNDKLTKELCEIGSQPESQIASNDFEHLDELIFDFFGMSQWEREYVTGVLNHDMEFIRQGSASDCVEPAHRDELKKYAATLTTAVNSNLQLSSLKANAIIAACTTELCAVVVRFDEGHKESNSVEEEDLSAVRSRLAELLHTPIAGAFQLRRDLAVFDDDRCILVKHSQKRLWSKARAYDDADRLFAELVRR